MMHRIWSVILEPVLRIVRPSVVVEAGGAGVSGAGTGGVSAEIHEHLLDLCSDIGATLRCADGLGALDELLEADSDVDAIVVPHESTWHSVSGVLERVDEWRRQSQRPFPLVVLQG